MSMSDIDIDVQAQHGRKWYRRSDAQTIATSATSAQNHFAQIADQHGWRMRTEAKPTYSWTTYTRAGESLMVQWVRGGIAAANVIHYPAGEDNPTPIYGRTALVEARALMERTA